MLTQTHTPDTQAELASLMQEAYQQATPVYPLGGQTALDYGIPAELDGIGLSTKSLRQVIDYPARDTTITVEAGMTFAELKQILAAEGQCLPWDVPHADQATLGGIVATNTNGPRRYKHGTVRDAIIGISAVDGRGVPFKAGGRVVKNVAGYDFCKLLTGSLGTLATITQLTFKLIPIPEESRWVIVDVSDLETVETLLAALVTSNTYPAAIELLAGPQWNQTHKYRIAVAIEGTGEEVDFMEQQFQQEWEGQTKIEVLRDGPAGEFLQRATDFPANKEGSVTLKASVVPSKVTELVHKAEELDPQANVVSHAGDGIVFLQLNLDDLDTLTQAMRSLRTTASEAQGNLVVWGHRIELPAEPALYWGSLGNDLPTMQKVKQTFDPKGLLNPRRFVYPPEPLVST